jgi:hypothetical protein
MNDVHLIQGLYIQYRTNLGRPEKDAKNVLSPCLLIPEHKRHGIGGGEEGGREKGIVHLF